MKKNSSSLPFKSNFFKEQDPFHLVIVFFIIFFGTAIFFSVPTFYDYKKHNQKIQEAINNEFKIKMSNLEDISFRFIPSPHLLIKNADLKIQNNETDSLGEIENIKVFISIAELYKSKNFQIKKIVIDKSNLYLNNLSLKNFIKNIKKSIVGNLIIKNTTLFYKDKKEEIILISKIKNFNYRTEIDKEKKILTIVGNIFDSNYEFKYIKDYNYPNVQNVTIDLKNPNILFQSKLIDDPNSLKVKQKGNINIKFLNNKNSINYVINENDIEFKNIDKKNFNFDLNGKINLKPFHFDLIVDIKKINLLQLEKILYYVYQNHNSKFKNLSGNLKLKLNDIDNKIIKNGFFNLFFEDSKMYLNKKIINLGDFASLEISDYEYLDNIDQILQIKVKINILDKEKFNRFFFNYKKNKIKKNNLYFIYQYNNNLKTNLISEISSKSFGSGAEFYKFNNLQQLKNLLRDENIFKLD